MDKAQKEPKTKTTQQQRKNNGNLKPFKKGQSGNPGGRPKGSTSFKLLMEKIGIEPSKIDPTKTKDEAIMRQVYEKAEEGDKWATQFVVENREGKPSQRIDITEHDPDEVRVIG